MATILGANTLSSGYDVANSCRFATNTYLAKTASSGNQRTFTVSFWAKRSMKATGHHHYPISFYQNANNRISFAFLSGNSNSAIFGICFPHGLVVIGETKFFS